jgi:hypothetical protein
MVWNEVMKKLAKPNKEVKAKAAELTAGVTTDEEKLRRIYSFVQHNIKNISYDRSLTEEQIENMDVKDADDALKRGMGRSVHVDMLFASLAKAAGYEVNLFLASDRSEYFFNADKYPFPSFVEWSGVGVKVGKNWMFFDPCQPYLSFGTLPWNREDVRAMLVGEGGFVWQTTPIQGPDKSPAKRTGKFTLAPDGSLEGTVKLEYEGQQAYSRRRDDFRDSQGKREENIKEEIQKRISTAEISNIMIENFDDNTKPLVYSFKVRVPNYAMKAGKRMIVQPGFFEQGSSALFNSATRSYDIYFPYPWSEEDNVEISLPKGYAIDSPDIPAPISDARQIGSLKVAMRVDNATNVLQYTRKFYFGGGGMTLFSVKAYPAIKGLFDAFHKADTHAVSLKLLN